MSEEITSHEQPRKPGFFSKFRRGKPDQESEQNHMTQQWHDAIEKKIKEAEKVNLPERYTSARPNAFFGIYFTLAHQPAREIVFYDIKRGPDLLPGAFVVQAGRQEVLNFQSFPRAETETPQAEHQWIAVGNTPHILEEYLKQFRKAPVFEPRKGGSWIGRMPDIDGLSQTLQILEEQAKPDGENNSS